MEKLTDRQNQSRIWRESENGTVFFSYNPEFKLEGGRLMYFRRDPEAGYEYAVMQGFLLKRLEKFSDNGEYITICGEFYYRESLEKIWNVREEKARTVRRTLKIPVPDKNGKMLTAYLESKKRQSELEPKTGAGEMFSGWLREVFGFWAEFFCAGASAVRWIFSPAGTETQVKAPDENNAPEEELGEGRCA